jgi:hypothetical protein
MWRSIALIVPHVALRSDQTFHSDRLLVPSLPSQVTFLFYTVGCRDCSQDRSKLRGRPAQVRWSCDSPTVSCCDYTSRPSGACGYLLRGSMTLTWCAMAPNPLGHSVPLTSPKVACTSGDPALPRRNEQRSARGQARPWQSSRWSHTTPGRTSGGGSGLGCLPAPR